MLHQLNDSHHYKSDDAKGKDKYMIKLWMDLSFEKRKSCEDEKKKGEMKSPPILKWMELLSRATENSKHFDRINLKGLREKVKVKVKDRFSSVCVREREREREWESERDRGLG